MKHTKLNIKKKEDNFKAVSFVHGMNTFQLKVLVKRLWIALQALANMMSKRRKDVPAVIDLMLDGYNWNEKMLDDRYVFTLHGSNIIRFDTLTKTFTLMDREYNVLETMQGHTVTDVRQQKAQRRRVRA